MHIQNQVNELNKMYSYFFSFFFHHVSSVQKYGESTKFTLPSAQYKIKAHCCATLTIVTLCSSMYSILCTISECSACMEYLDDNAMQ